MFVPLIPPPVNDFGRRRVVVVAFENRIVNGAIGRRFGSRGWIRERVVVIEIGGFGGRSNGRWWVGGVVEEEGAARPFVLVDDEVIEVVMLGHVSTFPSTVGTK